MKYVKIVSVLIGMLAIGLFYGWIDEKADHTFTKKGIHTHTLEIPKGAFADSSYMWSEERDFGSGRLTFRKNGDNRIAVVGLGSEGVISPEHPKYVVEYWVDASFMLGAASGHGMRWNISLTEKEVSYSLVCVQSSMIRIGTGFVALGAIIAAVLGFILWWILFPRRIKMVSPQMVLETGEGRRNNYKVNIVCKNPLDPFKKVHIPIFQGENSCYLDAKILGRMGPITFVKEKKGDVYYYYLAWEKDGQKVIHKNLVFVLSLTPMSEKENGHQSATKDSEKETDKVDE